MVLHDWKSSIEMVEQYLRYLRQPTNNEEKFVCQCKSQRSFGKFCEYLLPIGETFEATAQWQADAKREYPTNMQVYGDILCYTTLLCDSGLLCLDWRDICDGLQQCMFGYDEENCDKLELNECENDEYRCMNGMCIPDEYFLDGDYDCMDLSDEMQLFDDTICTTEEVSLKCDERICPPNQWSCGDGQCIKNRLSFQQFSKGKEQCKSRREQYHMCETNIYQELWTMPNGRCYESNDYDETNVKNHSLIKDCIYLLKCALSHSAETNCPCGKDLSCTDLLTSICSSDVIQYPNGGILAPYVFHFYYTTHDWFESTPDFMEINGTIKCQGNTIHTQMNLPYPSEFYLRDMESFFCTSSSNNHLSHFRFNDSYTFNNRSYNFIDVCNHPQGYISAYRINDGIQNCADGTDENQKELVAQTCSTIKRYRFRCSSDEPTCLLVNSLGNFQLDCQNDHDESWLGTEKMLSEMDCDNQLKADCKNIRQYIETSWLSDIDRDINAKLGPTKAIPFRAYCDTFWNLGSKNDEDAEMCRKWWICPKEQWQCGTGQCINVEWVLDGEWDCSDASDEEGIFVSNYTSLEHNLKFYSHSQLKDKFITLYGAKPFGELCNLTMEYPCYRVNVSDLLNNLTEDRFCISLKQIGDGQVDCLGGLDERNILKHCDRTTMLGDSFKCLTSNTCIDYSMTCDIPCPNKSDDESLCDALWNKDEDCSGQRDSVCLNRKCAEDGWCNKEHDCKFGEDEYMCDEEISSTAAPANMVYRRKKESDIKNTPQKLQLPWFPFRIDQIKTARMIHPVSSSEQIITASSDLMFSPIPYTCNRGVAVQIYNGSIACFCPPEYYGDKCQFHSDRMVVYLHLNFSGSFYTNSSKSTIVLKVLVIFLFENETLLTSEFHVRPAVEITTYTKKIDHVLYSRSPHLIHHKRARYLNRSNIVQEHPYSLRIEAYELDDDEIPRLSAVWQYPIHFDYLPSFRFAKVLRIRRLNTTYNPCSSGPCGPTEECHQLLNQESSYVCLCANNFTGKNCSIQDPICTAGFCRPNSICKPYYRGLLSGNHLPYCVCPYNTFGRRCDATYDACTLNGCQHNGTCYPSTKPNEYFCACSPDYYGTRCEIKKPSVYLYINEIVEYQAAVVQYFHIEYSSLDLILVQQNAYTTLPDPLHYHLEKQTVPPEIILAKLYSQTENDIYLISVQWSRASINITIKLTDQNRCAHVRSLYVETSVFMYHQFCINNTSLLCFRDDAYLCICDEKHTRAECFTYNNHLDHCSHCLNGGRCLKGDQSKKDDYICLCPSCHSGQHCQFTSQLSMINFDILFVTDLQSNNLFVQRTVFYSLIIGPWIFFLLGLVNNTASFFTFYRRKCRQSGIGQYLLYMSIVNQLFLSMLACRLTRLAVNLSGSYSNPAIDNALCKLLPTLLGICRHMGYWLISLIAIERAYITLFLNGRWLKKPGIAQRFILLTFISVLGMNTIQFVARKSYTEFNNQLKNICLLALSPFWALIYQVISIGNTVLPFLINLCCTIIIMCVVITKRMNTITKHVSNPPIINVSSINLDESQVDEQQEHTKADRQHLSIKLRIRLHLLRDVLSENKELLVGPAFTLIPQLFSLPILIVSFSLVCQAIETSPLRYLLIVSEFASFIPQIISFFLYISPSSLYSTEWRATKMYKRIIALTRRH